MLSQCREISLVECFIRLKAAYEMRISDWSSDVCSSDLQRQRRIEILGEAHARKLARARGFHRLMDRLIEVDRSARDRLPARELLHLLDQRRDAADLGRSDGRRVGKECVIPFSSRWSRVHHNKH